MIASSTSLARNVSMSGTANELALAVNSFSQSPKIQSTLDAQHKSVGKNVNTAHSTQADDGGAKSTKYFGRDMLHSAKRLK